MTVEWIVLLLLVPLVIVPIVLLCGFSGCNAVFGLHQVPYPPVITQAEALDVSSIRLSWTYQGSTPVSFEVHRTPLGDTTVTKLPQTAALTLDDTGVAEGSTYLYDITSFPQDSDSATSSQVVASTFGKTFEAVLDGERTRERRTIVQRIEPSQLARTGTRVLITIQQPAAGDLVINAATISRAADAAYAPASDLTTFIASPLLILADPANGPHVVDPVDYALDHTQPLLLAFDIQVPGNVRERSPIPAADGTAFVSPLDVFEATLPVRSAGYGSETRIYLVQRIDVV